MSKKKILDNTMSYEDDLLDSLKEPVEAAAYLQVAFDAFQMDGNFQALLLALRDVTNAQGGISELSEKTHLNRQSLYKTLSSTGNPKLDTFGSIIRGLGFTLTITPTEYRDRHL